MPNDFLDILLKKRTISPEDHDAFLNPSYDTHIHDPFLMKDMEKAVLRIKTAISSNEKIAIFADYDCDGIPGAVVLHDFFKKMGHDNIEVYIPDRHKEGYGLNKPALDTLRKNEVTLLITVDLGISNTEDVLYANKLGFEVIITDHHIAQKELPKNKVYFAGQKINNAVALKTQIEDFIECNTTKARINPKYRKVDE